MTSLLSSSLSGLFAAQRSLETASNNISNVNTEGYSRQRSEQSARPTEFSGAGYIGTGVDVNSVTRSYDQFITKQVNVSASTFHETDTFVTLSSQVDSIVANEDSGLTPALKSFFSAVNGLANDPSSVAVRQTVLSEADALSQQFNTLSTQFNTLLDQTNTKLKADIDDINSYTKDIAALNVQIAYGGSRSGQTQLPNDLLDKRDLLIAKIAEKVNVSTIPQPDGTLSVLLANGQPLVLSSKAETLSIAPSSTDYKQKDILLNGQSVISQISGGDLGGALKFRDEILQPAQQQLGLAAAGFALEFNKIHSGGYDLKGNAGQDLFQIGSPHLSVPVVAKSGSTGTASSVYDTTATGQLYPSDYSLSYDGSDYKLTRLSDNTVTTFAGLPASTTITGPGFKVTTSSAAAGDSFLIRPAYEAAGSIKLQISDTHKVAAAGAHIPGPPVQPVPGDNTVALELAGLENKSFLLNGTATVNDSYSRMVSNVGSLTHAAKINQAAQEVLYNRAKESRESVAGVNLDEEAANLIKFQNAYQASAKAISVAQSLFDSLIAAFR
jgi:flagellar hook-associated protein 1 FlgK